MVALKTSRLFSSLIATELAALEQTAQIRSYATGGTIFQEGDSGDGIYVIIDGSVQITAVVGQGERRVLAKLGPGDFFGEMAVLDNEPRSATALAERDTKVYFIPRGDILEMLERSPRLAVSLVREFSLRMRDFNRQYIQEVLQAERLTLVGKFARSIVHDFKNPLNVIGLSAEMAAMTNATPEMRKSAKERIGKQVNRLSTMITELLEFTRGSQVTLVLADTDYSTYARQVVEELRPDLDDKSVKLVLENEPPAISVLLDPGRLTHVFYNLVHNAVDAMPDGGTLTLRFKQNSKWVTTEIQDSGKGIAPEIAGRLFEAFATYGKAQGTGLGLSICKKIIEDHRGTIEARCVPAPGQGAIFAFMLPRREKR